MGLFGKTEKTNKSKADVPKEKVKKHNTFDDMKKIWKKSEFNKLSNYQKKKMAFLLNRFMAIQFPIHAAMVNRKGVSEVGVVDFWANFLQLKYGGRIPGWFWSKASKDFNIFDDMININLYSDEVLSHHYSTHERNKQELLDLCEMYPKVAQQELEESKAIIEFSVEMKKR